ncbi:hypothetical protein P7K49_012795, partial [Saguinus oedipus]
NNPGGVALRLLRPGGRAARALGGCDWCCLAARRGAERSGAGHVGTREAASFRLRWEARGGRMVKLTAELIEQAAQYTNAVRDRELDLRGESGGAGGQSPGGTAPPYDPRSAACTEGRNLARGWVI